MYYLILLFTNFSNSKSFKNDKNADKGYYNTKFQQNGVKTHVSSAELPVQIALTTTTTRKPITTTTTVAPSTTSTTTFGYTTSTLNQLTTKDVFSLPLIFTPTSAKKDDLTTTKFTDGPTTTTATLKNKSEIPLKNFTSKTTAVVEANVVVSGEESDVEKNSTLSLKSKSNFIEALKANSLASIEALKTLQNTKNETSYEKNNKLSNYVGLEAITNPEELKFRDLFSKVQTTPQFSSIQPPTESFGVGVGGIREINLEEMHKQKETFSTTPNQYFRDAKTLQPNSRNFRFLFYFLYYY